uniref:Uncharacterized protein n=1 Tax=Chromera velia CCMP2878 TaxID=1169474 RepID=A0A0G4I9Y6_9ALVE|eukprot:Cvel_12298.t1-p1 / transcript=Cvel_12298.t1 / gene=Cvel_12298 / organism=Chromera_velia_CCMP2878 / gene_product=Leucine-rich repeat-containing protein 34, putative / transcript_product=Leucine-rich repeat-containing protein 34, putative / location=Cvel_scaffold798:48185-56588(+) / protein_length=405 / sequence_SO=supercontig / SO=protein_coding / is_pseudo=false
MAAAEVAPPLNGGSTSSRADPLQVLNDYTTAGTSEGLSINPLIVEQLSEAAKAQQEDAEVNHLVISAPGNDRRVFSNRIGDTDIALISKVFSPQGFALQYVDFSYNTIGDKGAAGIANMLPECPNLRALILRSNDIGPYGAHMIASKLSVCTELSKLDLSFNPIGRDGGMSVAAYLQTPNKLLHLDVDSAEVNIDVLIALAAVLHVNNRTLCILNVENPRLFTLQQEHCTHFGRMLQVNTRLMELYLGKQKIRDEGTQVLVSHLFDNRALRVLDLRCNEISVKGAFEIARLLESDAVLQWLNLEANRMQDEGAFHIADALKYNRHLSTLERFQAVHNDFGPTAAAKWGKLLQKAPKVVVWSGVEVVNVCERGGEVGVEDGFSKMVEGFQLNFDSGFDRDVEKETL